MTDSGTRNELRRGWRPLLACAFGIGLGLSPLPTFTGGIFAVELAKEFGWSRGSIMFSHVLGTVTLLLLAPFIGRLTDKIGPRRVALASTVGLGLSMSALGLINQNILTFYFGYFVMQAVSLGTLPIVYAKVINIWFDDARGLALGMALCTTGITGVFAPIYVATLIEAFGWRLAYVGVGALPLLIAFPVIFMLLPGERAAVRKHVVPPSGLEGFTIQAALRNYRYWVLCFFAMAGGMSVNGILSNMAPLLVDRGFTTTEAAKMLGIYGFSVIVGRLLGGYLLDRFWGPAVGFVFLAIPIAAALMLASGITAVPLILLASAMIGMAGGAEFDIIAYLTSRYFGRQNFSALYAGQYAAFGVGAGTAPVIFAGTFDAYGTYTPVLLFAAVLFGLAATSLLFLGRYPVLPKHVPEPGADTNLKPEMA